MRSLLFVLGAMAGACQPNAIQVRLDDAGEPQQLVPDASVAVLSIADPAAPSTPRAVETGQCPEGFSQGDLNGNRYCRPFTADPPQCSGTERAQPGQRSCIPVSTSCPTETFPDGLSATAIYVAAEALSPGNGSRTAPFRSLRDALMAAPDGATVAVARGIYRGEFVARRGIHLEGVCASETILESATARDVPSTQAFRPVLTLDAASARHLTIRSPNTLAVVSRGDGLLLSNGSTGEDLIVEASNISVVVPDGSSGVLRRSLVLESGRQTAYVGARSDLRIENSEVRRPTHHAFVVRGSLTVADTLVRDLQWMPTNDRIPATAMTAMPGSRIELVRSAFLDIDGVVLNQDSGTFVADQLWAEGAAMGLVATNGAVTLTHVNLMNVVVFAATLVRAQATLSDVIVAETFAPPRFEQYAGRIREFEPNWLSETQGIYVSDSRDRVSMERVLVSGMRTSGLQVTRSSVTLRDISIDGVVASSGAPLRGTGMDISGAIVDGEHLRIVGCEYGMLVRESELTLEDTTVAEGTQGVALKDASVAVNRFAIRGETNPLSIFASGTGQARMDVADFTMSRSGTIVIADGMPVLDIKRGAISVDSGQHGFIVADSAELRLADVRIGGAAESERPLVGVLSLGGAVSLDNVALATSQAGIAFTGPTTTVSVTTASIENTPIGVMLSDPSSVSDLALIRRIIFGRGVYLPIQGDSSLPAPPLPDFEALFSGR